MYLIHWYEAMNATTGKGKRFWDGWRISHKRLRDAATEMRPASRLFIPLHTVIALIFKNHIEYEYYINLKI